MTKKPAMASRVGADRRSPSVTKVAGLATTMPAFLSAMMPRKRPMPAEIAMRCEVGMASTMSSRTCVTLRMRKSTPEMKTAPSATCQE
jgi:hypothetical protein